MILAVELQRQFPVGDVPPGAVERGGILSALALAEDEVAVGGTAESGGAGDHVHGIIVIHLPQMMHQQNGDAVFVRQRFQNADVPIVAGIRVCVIACGADALERVDDDEPGLRMLLQKLLDLFHQPVMELLGHDGEVQRGRCVLREIKEAALEKEFGKFSIFPDLIMMDGGRGQVNVALRVLDRLNLKIPVCGMVKDDNHRTRGLYFHNVEIPIDTNSEGFRLITRIQDEAHRFAIEYHRSLRSKEQVHSILDDIEGIGPTRRKSLMRTFQSLEAIREAEVEELKKAPSMNEQSARRVYEFFHKKCKENEE